MSQIDRALIEAIIRDAMAEVGGEKPVKLSPQSSTGLSLQVRGEGLPAAFDGQLDYARPQRIFDAEQIEKIKSVTPARLAMGRTGTRYLTTTYIGLRAEHAIALDAVHAPIPDGWAEKLGCITLKTKAKDKEEYLLHPEQGRWLDDESREKLAREGSRGLDIQLILSDGLAAWGILQNGPALLPALTQELARAGFKVGRPIFVKYGRIGVADEIGVMLGAKATLIAVGERPGLGTGDSLSIYTAHTPRLGQDNAEKDCISNIRQLGIPPVEAAKEATRLLQRTFKAGGGGTHLTRSGL